MNIGEAKTRLSELVAAAVRGETVVLQKAGKPMVRLVPVEDAASLDREARQAKRLSALGVYREQLEGLDLSLEALKADRVDADERWAANLARPR